MPKVTTSVPRQLGLPNVIVSISYSLMLNFQAMLNAPTHTGPSLLPIPRIPLEIGYTLALEPTLLPRGVLLAFIMQHPVQQS